MDELKGPRLPDLTGQVRKSYSVPRWINEELARLSAQRGISETLVVSEFLAWAIEAYKKGFRP